MQIITAIIAIITGIGAGFIIGKYGSKFSEKIYDRRLKKGFADIMSGKRENKTEIDGKIIEVDKFILKDEDGKKILVSFKDGIVASEKVPVPKSSEPIVQDKESKKPSLKKNSTKKGNKDGKKK